MEGGSFIRDHVLSWPNVAAMVLVYIVTISIYRLTLHPLARIPGPKLAAITRYYEVYYDVLRNGQYTFKIAEMHKKYGPIIRISPHELHVIDPAFFEKLYRQDGRWDKYDWSYRAFSAPGSAICSGPHDIHKARRAALNPFFSKARVGTQQEMMDRSIIILRERLSEFAATGGTVDLGAATSACTRDIACEFLMDKAYENLRKEDFSVQITNMLQQGGSVWRITKHVPWFGPLMRSISPSIMTKIADDGTTAFLSYVQESEQDTKNLLKDAASSSNPSTSRTIVHEIYNSKLPTPEKQYKRVADEVFTITGAGFETTASALRLIIYHIYANPPILAKLREELAPLAASSSAADGLPAYPDLKLRSLEQSQYLTCIIMEGMRLSPALGSRMARIAPDRDIFYGDDNVRIPAGTPVGMTTILMHTDKSIYPDPLSFVPERWMHLEKRRQLEKTYAPFSKGTRNCLGMQYAPFPSLFFLLFSHHSILFSG
ncbi:unnamed protein product [Periconia digitata]|uniref:Cytochrome P450 n=1 Tax=Periconia digitata TaxID=1303443 RepID=A0A9W4U7X7_9PLEO|nr:unnamed protein product [Periconia digitata]